MVQGTHSDRTAMITGGSRGVGRGIAITLAAAGCAVALTYRRDADSAEDTLEEIRRAGGSAIAVQASMEDPDDLERAVAEVRRELGPIDLLVSNAGLASRGNPVAETEPAEVERLFQVHAMAAFRLSRLLLEDFRAADRSDMIFVSSTEVSRSPANGAPYNVAKAALEAFAMTLAKEEAPNGVRVNVVAPGLVVTDMGDRLVKAVLDFDSAAELDRTMPFGRVVRPADVGDLVVFLTSDSAQLMTGQRIELDGGSNTSPTTMAGRS